MTALPRWIDEKEYCRIRGCALQTARNERFMRRGPAYYKFGRQVRYKLNEVLEWCEAGRVDPEAAG